MGSVQGVLDVVVIGLLAATLFHAGRLERALGGLKRDRSALDELMASFNASTQAAETAIINLRGASEDVGDRMAAQAQASAALKEDMQFLIERGETLADRLDGLVRAARPLAVATPERSERAPAEGEPEAPRVRSQAERDLLRALKMGR